MRLGLEPDITIVGEADDAKSALPLVQRLQPDVILMDVRMPGIDGIIATAGLRAVAPHSAVIILSLYSDPATRARALAAGAAAFVEKQDAGETLLAEIRRAARPRTQAE